MAISTMLPMIVHPTVTMGLIGFLVGCSSGLGPGSTALTDFMAMSTTATILTTATTDRFRYGARSRSTISTLTRRSMSMATPAIPAMMEAANTPLDSPAEAIPVVAAVIQEVAEVIAR